MIVLLDDFVVGEFFVSYDMVYFVVNVKFLVGGIDEFGGDCLWEGECGFSWFLFFV